MTRTLRLVILVIGGLMAAGTEMTMNEAVAQSAREASVHCQQQLAFAQREYLNGAFQQTIGAVSECLNQAAVAPSDAAQAYRLLALAHMKQDEFGAARQAVVNLLGVRPNYQADRVNDPPAFVSVVSIVRQSLKLGPSVVLARPPRTLPPENVASINVSLRPIAIPSQSNREASSSFFKRSNTWLTIGGVMVGGSAQSGEHAIGLGIGAIGVGAGGEFTGIGVGGLAVSGGEALEGIMVGGIGVGSGRRVDGIAIGGGAVGSGGSLRGLMVGGLGVGSGEGIHGLTLGGLGVGTGSDLTGGAFALLGVGGRGNVTGFTAAGLGVGAGNHLRGLHVAGGGVVASKLSGIAIGGIVSNRDANGFVAAPLYARIADEGRLAGLSVSLFNHVNGRQRGVTVGLLNIANNLRGVQLGAINYAGNNPILLRVLPLINLHF